MKTKLLGSLAIVLGVFLFAGVAAASTADVLQPASDIVYNENVDINGSLNVDSLRVGIAGLGGVTFFNGSVLNEGVADPFTVADDFRVDGEIWRTEKGGANPIKISDHVIPTLTNTNNFGTASNRWNNIYGKNGNFSGNLQVNGVSGLTDSDIPNNITVSNYLPLAGGTVNNLTVSNNLTVKNINWSSPKESYYSFDAYPCMGQEYQNEIVPISSGSLLVCSGVSSSSSADMFMASWPINLPNNSEIKSFKANMYDQASNRDVSCYLRRKEVSKSNETHNDLSSLTTGPNLTSTPGWTVKETSSITNGTVDNSKYSYSIFCHHSGSVGVGQDYSDVGALGFVVKYSQSSPN